MGLSVQENPHPCYDEAGNLLSCEPNPDNCGGGPGLAPGEVRFRVDMNEGPEQFGTVYVTGPFCSWCADGYPLEDDDGDGIWEGVYTFGPEQLNEAGELEYKYMVDGWASQEDLVDDMNAGAQCAPVTDYANYANRLVYVGEYVQRPMMLTVRVRAARPAVNVLRTSLYVVKRVVVHISVLQLVSHAVATTVTVVCIQKSVVRMASA